MDNKARKTEILERTGEGIKIASKAVFDLFTGGHEAVLDDIAESFEERRDGKPDRALHARYRCGICRDVHREGAACPEAKTTALLTEGHEVRVELTVCTACLKTGEDARATTFGDANVRACMRCKVELRASDRAFVTRE